MREFERNHPEDSRAAVDPAIGRRRAGAAAPGWDGSAVRIEPGPGSIHLWEVALIIALVGVTLPVLPRRAIVPAAAILPVAYLVARNRTRSFIGVATLLLALAPPWVDGRPDIMTIVVLIPLYLRLLTWWDRTGRWDILDPLVIFTAPVWFLTLPAHVVGFLEWLDRTG